MDNLIKNAGFIDGFLKTVAEKVGFREKPFETIFSIIGTAVIWRLSKVLGLLAFIGESMGYGPGLIGRALDDYFKSSGSKSIDNMDLSESNLKAASEFAVLDMAKNMLGNEKTSAMNYIDDIISIKKSININDLSTAVYASMYFKKEAIGRSSKTRRFLLKVLGGQRLGIANVLYGIVKLFVKGLIGLGIIGGVKSVVKDIKEKDKNEVIKTTPSGMKRYKNEKGNVKETLINLLNTINFKNGTFETTFRNKYNVPLRNSSQMNKLLTQIRILNQGQPINIMDKWDIFFGPSLKDMANILMPEFAYRGGANRNELSNLIKEL